MPTVTVAKSDKGVVANAMTEAQLLANVIEMAGYLGWLCYHPWTSIHSAKGFPDLTLVRPDGRLIFAELKREREEPRASQWEWLTALATVPGVSVVVWRPSSWLNDEILETLR